MMVTTAYTVGAYTFILAVVASYVYFRVFKANGNRARQPPQRTQAIPPEPKAEPKKKKARNDGGNKQPTKKAKAAEKPREQPQEEQPQRLSNVADEKEEPVDDREFAKQLASLKEGKKFDRRTGEAASYRQKSVKQSRATREPDVSAVATTGSTTTEEKASVSAPSAPSSSAGADASAEPTPDASPVVAPVDATGVADMLEPAPAGPSVLRLVDTKDAKPKAAKSKPKEVKETKKQRQNRRKAEEQKAAREAAEVERKKLEEAQRRLARISEGRPARDGSQSIMVHGKEAWNDNNKAAGNKNTPDVGVQFLDTFDDQASVAAPAPATAASKSDPKSDSKPLKFDDSWMSELPSEEEQMKLAKADSEWSTVKTKSSKKSKKEAQDAPSPATASPTAEPAVLAAPQSSFESQPTKAPKPSGSFAALSTSADAEEEEIEWDV